MSEEDVYRVVLRSILAAAFVGIGVLVLLRLVDLLVLVFAAAVIATLLNAAASALSRRTPLPHGVALAVFVLAIVAAVGALGWLFGMQIRSQFAGLVDSLPSAWRSVQDRIRELPGGDAIVNSLNTAAPANAHPTSRFLGIVSSITSAATDFLLITFGSIFIAASPEIYRVGLLKLVPRSRREVAADALSETGRAVRLWMVGQFVSMGVIGTFTGIGLWLVGVPSPLALGIIAGAAEIIPWAGPIIAAVPVLIVALAESPPTALLALIVMIVIQQIEGSVIMPYVQKKAVTIPPAVTVFGVVAGGLLFGPVGLIFAGPLLVVTYVFVKRLYVEEMLGTDTKMPGEHS